MNAVDFGRLILNFVRQKRIERLGTNPTWQKTPEGFWMRIDPLESMDIAYFLGSYEPALVRIIKLLVSTEDAAVDIGTHKGYITLALAKAVGSRGRVVSVDPDPRAFAEMTANCRRNRYDQVVQKLLAAGDSEGTCSFSLTSQLGNSSRFPNKIAKPTVISVMQAEVKSLDQILREEGALQPNGKVRFIKIDAEGSELLVLLGMKETIAIHHPAIYMEINNGSLTAGGASASHLQQTLEQAGYRLYKVAWKKDIFSRVQISLQYIQAIQADDTFCYEVLAMHESDTGWKRIQHFAA